MDTATAIIELSEKIDRLIESPTVAPRWLTIATAAVYCDLSEDSIRRLISSGKLAGHRPVKGRVLIDRGELDSFVSTATTVPRKGRGRT